MNRLICLALLLSGCPWIGPDEHTRRLAEDSDSDTLVTGGLAIDAIEPAFGPTNIATDIRIIVEGLEPAESEQYEQYEVYIGGERAEIVEVTADSLFVRAPVRTSAGRVDVELLTADDSVVVDDGFRFFTNRAGGAGTIGYIERYVYSTHSWPTRASDRAVAYIALLTGEAPLSPWQPFAPRLDSCSASTSIPDLFSYAMDDSVLTLVRDDETEVDLPTLAQGDSAFFMDNLPVNLLSGSFALAPFAGGPELPAFGIDPLVEMPPTAVPIQPNLSGGGVERNAFYFRWRATDISSDLYVIRITVMTPNYDEIIETVSCAAAMNDGIFRISPTVFTQWSGGNVMEITAGRVRSNRNTLPHNLSTNTVYGGNFFVGTAVQVAEAPTER